MNTIFKTITKIANSKIRDYLTTNEKIAPNQFAFLRDTLGCKEGLLVDEIITKDHPDLKVIWLGIKKAFDSIQHEYIFRRLEPLRIPHNITKFIKAAYSKAHTTLQIINNKNIHDIGTVAIRKGVMQGDSLSPTLFMLALEPLSRELNKLPKVTVGSTSINHLMYMDDIKLVSNSESELVTGKVLTEEILKKISLNINHLKYGTLDNLQT